MFAIHTPWTTMRRAVHMAAAGRWPEADATGTLTLVFDDRHRRRVRLTTDDGADLLLDLPRAVALADGDGLLLDDGEWLRVAAAPEPLLEVVAVSPQHLARLAWHIGNRHLQAEPFEDRIRIRPDHVVAEMLRGLGAEVRDVTQPFQPEGGAYDQKSDPGSHAGSQQAGHTHA
ncbi:MAG: urease accessory protein UreE [Chloroflexi bacterium]|nr:urease accessory protein UreE [Chloroflexota bacterium]